MTKNLRLGALTILMSLPLFSSMSARGFEHPRAVYATSTSLTVNAVTFTPEATSVTFRYTGSPYSWIRMSSATFATDEQGRRYPVLSMEGLQPDSMLRLTDAREVGFTIHFAPLPMDTRAFDIIEGRQHEDFRIYGIHDAATPLAWPKAVEAVDDAELDMSLFKADSVVIRGRIHGAEPADMPEEMKVYSNAAPRRTEEGLTAHYTSKRLPDGSFSCTLPADRPTWHVLSFGGSRFYDYYVRPGDTLWIDITNYKRWDEQVAYRSTKGHPCFGRLMTEGDMFYDDGSYTRMFREEYKEHLEQVAASADSLQDYLAWKYKFTPWEVHLLKTQQRLQLAFLQAFFMDAWRHHQTGDGAPVALPAGSLSMFDRIRWDDNTIAVSKVWSTGLQARIPALQIILPNLTEQLRKDVDAVNNF